MHKKRASVSHSIRRIEDTKVKRLKDRLVAEEPLTIICRSSDGHNEHFAATMRTPGQDFELAAGMLFAEKLIEHKSQVRHLDFCVGGGENELNRLLAELRFPQSTLLERLQGKKESSRAPQSACGLCQKEELASVDSLVGKNTRAIDSAFVPTPEELQALLTLLEEDSPLFQATGASHACLVASSKLERLALAEDVGRHNACDKAIGSLVLGSPGEQNFQLEPGCGLLFSSRLSFELAAKGVRAGAHWLASVGAPTSAAVSLARASGIPLFGFLSRNRVNQYS